MYQLHTKKQRLYFEEVIRLHYEEGFWEDRMSRLLPAGHTTASRWIAIFAKEKGNISGAKVMKKPQVITSVQEHDTEEEELKKRVKGTRGAAWPDRDQGGALR